MFNEIIGNEKIKDLLTNSIKSNQTSHSYLFLGTEGIGKKLIAKEFAKNILCLESENFECKKCKSCIEFLTNNNPDYTEIVPDGNSIKISQIREMQKRIQEKPIISKNKVYIIDDADKMTPEAQNCLLKTLEEPPQFAKIILIGSNENTFLNTIKSRCTILHFENLSNQEISNFLKNNYNITNLDEETLNIFQGSLKKAIELKDKKDLYTDVKKVIEDFNKKDLIDILQEAEFIYKSKEDITEILDYINTILINKMKKEPDSCYFLKCIKIVEETKKRLKQNSNYDMCIDNLLFNMWEEIN